MKLYKLTDESETHYRTTGAIQHPVRSCCVCGQTYRQTQWGEGVEHTAPGTGELCGAGWIQAYKDLPTLARAALVETKR